jgi:hypothetical protein
MARSRYGSGRHVQPWREMECPACGYIVMGRNTLPGKPPHIKVHFGPDSELCSGEPLDPAGVVVGDGPALLQGS